jgi:hypothetical protein
MPHVPPVHRPALRAPLTPRMIQARTIQRMEKAPVGEQGLESEESPCYRCGYPMAGEGRLDTVRALIDGGADVNAACGTWTPMTIAQRRQSAEMPQVLRDHGAR